MNLLAQMVEELTIETRGADDARGLPLLVQLQRAINGNVGGTVAGASSGSPVPINVGALELWDALTDEINTAAEGLDARMSDHPLVNLSTWWVSLSAMIERGDASLAQIETAADKLMDWAHRIRDVFTAARHREVMVPCPNCGYERITLGEGEQQAEVFALVASIQDGEVTVSCRNPHCVDAFGERSEWAGTEPLAELGRRTGNLIGAQTLRAALEMPTEAVIVPKPREVIPLQDDDPDRDELIAQRIVRIVNGWLKTRKGREGDYLDLLHQIDLRLGRPMSGREHAALLDHLRELGAVGTKATVTA